MAISKIGFSEYIELDGLNQSSLKRILDSPLHFKEGAPPDSRAFRMGRLVDTLALEPAKAGRHFVVVPDFKNDPDNVTDSGKPSTSAQTRWCKERLSDFAREHAGKEFISQAECDEAEAMANRIRYHQFVQSNLDMGAEAQITLTGTIEGVECKGLVDLWLNRTGPARIIDLKTTIDARPKQFRRSFFKYRYDFQLAFYRMLAKANGVDVPATETYIIAASKSPEKDVVVYSIPPEWIAQAEEDVYDAIGRYKSCLLADHWPGVSGDSPTMSLGYDNAPELVITE